MDVTGRRVRTAANLDSSLTACVAVVETKGSPKAIRSQCDKPVEPSLHVIAEADPYSDSAQRTHGDVPSIACPAGQHKQYSGRASLLLRNPGFDQTLFGSQTFQAETDPTREAATNLDLASLSIVSQHTATKLGAGYSADEVSGDVGVSPQG